MLYLIIGIVIGAAFHEFWHELFEKSKNKVNKWFSEKTSEDSTSSDSASSRNTSSDTVSNASESAASDQHGDGKAATS